MEQTDVFALRDHRDLRKLDVVRTIARIFSSISRIRPDISLPSGKSRDAFGATLVAVYAPSLFFRLLRRVYAGLRRIV